MFDHNLFDFADQSLLKKFKEFHTENPFVFEKFKEYAQKIRKSGHSKYSAWTIINVIRWEKDLSTTGGVFKINNDFIALYARLLMANDYSFRTFLNCVQ